MSHQRPYEDVTAQGHLIDSNILASIMDTIVEFNGEFEMLSLDIGKGNDNPSKMVMRVFAESEEQLSDILFSIQEYGVVPLCLEDVQVAPAPADGVFPEDFYATTNLETFTRLSGKWIRVANPEMDMGVRLDPSLQTATSVPLSHVQKGELYIVGRDGIRITPQERPRESAAFEFMNSTVSSEKPKEQIIEKVASLLTEVTESRKKTIVVAGPAVVHTGAAKHLSRLVDAGYIDVLFGGNAIATHDIEVALYGTSLGIDMSSGIPVAGGHEHHLRAINRIRAAGTIQKAVENGILTSGLMYTLVKTGTPFVLAGSIRDDGPMPDVITDALEAQEAMRYWCQQAGVCVMLSTMLHSIATGNMLPSSVTTVCVDINPAVVTKLADRGSWQTIGIVTDVGLFLEQLADKMRC